MRGHGCYFWSFMTFVRLEIQRGTQSSVCQSQMLLYLQHLGEERDNADHDEEQADAINLLSLRNRICN